MKPSYITTLEEAKALDFLLEAYCRAGKTYQPPIDVAMLATSLGYEVFASNFEEPDVVGFVNSNKRQVHVNRQDAPVRQRFTIAHELGHVVLGHLTEENPLDVLYRSQQNTKGNTQQEHEANTFAASLLMPRDLFYHYFRLLAQDTVALARLFNVSNENCYYRLKDLFN